jgi:hypothetical protein
MLISKSVLSVSVPVRQEQRPLFHIDERSRMCESVIISRYPVLRMGEGEITLKRQQKEHFLDLL